MQLANEPTGRIYYAVYIAGFQTNTYGESAEEAARYAVDFFLDPFWKGPKPDVGTVLIVKSITGEVYGVKTVDTFIVPAKWMGG